ncbi:NTP transferase domain-containing protein [Nitratireductor basaltis]|uniref:Molybdopterin molybdochelatase / molybdenum cofactor cytidylyltransferase n=1 Tax=Nitratireductor basaltis TaxID=472175 RepID=A0A084UBD8_9HYPH|nr:molybdopterin-binding/glycosyltransferase family 2 protein [Nitratireductor basaltis]KFB10274.1 Molybdopterin molybdochelatase / molybdenum cofactor cytidylyltransferase [Nitratireductor basaltis]
MKFGPLPLDEAEGAVLAHTLTVGDRRFRKAHRLDADDIVRLRDAGVETVIAALLEEADIPEDDAARMLAEPLVSAAIEARAPSTGRVNLHASMAGVLRVERTVVDRMNAVDPALTLATLPDYSNVQIGQMVATVKIIPFASSRRALETALETLKTTALQLFPFRALQVGLIQTDLPGTKGSVLDKTSAVTAERLARSKSRIIRELRPAHDELALAEAIDSIRGASDLIIIFGASAVCDENDVLPAAIRQAGGTVERVGMPVDPGNLLVLGSLDGKVVLGAPGCARSPKLNGFDWVLDRITADIPVQAADIAAMGVGGLLSEIASRPHPREKASSRGRALKVHGLLLAAGQSRRMGPSNKLLARMKGKSLVRGCAEMLQQAALSGVSVVLGHEASMIREELGDLPINFCENRLYATGLASSLKAGLRYMPEGTDAVLVMLADMPRIAATHVDRMIDAFRDAGGTAIIRATHAGKRGNPVILPRALFPEIEKLEGDTGARHIVESAALPVIDVEIGSAAHLDLDTPEALKAAGGTFE